MTGGDTNRFVGEGWRRQMIINSVELRSGKSWTLSSEGGAVFSGGSMNLAGALTVKAGSILKSVQTTVADGGSLNVQGTSAAPVVFTSYSDDSVGGDTNGDGDATSPSDSATWAGSHIVTTGGTATVAFADLRYVHTAISDCCGFPAALSVLDSTIRGRVDLFRTNRPVLKRNTFALATQSCCSRYALQLSGGIDPSGIVMTGGDTNRFVGEGWRRQMIINSVELRSGKSWTLSSEGGAVFSGGSMNLAGALTVKAGSILKSVQTTVADGGSLNVQGTSAAPVVFTSYSDDSVGGDTNGDGDATSPSDSATWAGSHIVTTGGTATVAFADLRYVHTAISDCCGFPAALSVLDSTIRGRVDLFRTNRPVLKRNTFALATQSCCSRYALQLSGGIDPSGIVMTGGDTNRFVGEGWRRQMIINSVELRSGKSWTLSSEGGAVFSGGSMNLAGALTVKAGSILKSVQTTVADGGSLNVQGTSAAPVVFTSYSDDSVGGDTNGDGDATSPSDSATWAGSHIVTTGGTATVAFADLRYVHTAISDCCGFPAALSVLDSTIRGRVDLFRTNRPVLKRNTFALATQSCCSRYALQLSGGIDPSGIVMTGGDTNRFVGEGWRRQMIINSVELRSGKSWTLSSEGGAVFSGGSMNLAGALTVKAGSILKSVQTTVADGGSLNVQGTSAAPVVFTSYSDDSVGGDTNGDGDATSPSDSATWAGSHIVTTGGTATVAFADLRYVHTAISDCCGFPAALSVLDSTIRGRVDLFRTNRPVLKRNTFALATQSCCSRYALQLSGGIDPSGIVMTGGDTNRFVGEGWRRQMIINSVELRSGKSWTLSSEGGAVFSGGSMNLAGALTVKAGSILKSVQTTVADGGSLNVQGTSAAPVVFTSYSDDSVGGDTNGDGDATSPDVGSWSGIKAMSGSAAHLERTTIRYAATAVDVDNAEVTVRGRILDSSVGVSSEIFVDARGVDWGHPSGPAPIGSGTAIAGGAVSVTPWVGYVEPPRPPVAPPPNPPEDPECYGVFFVGVRGSGDLPQGEPPSYSGDGDGMGPRPFDMYFGFQERMHALRPDVSIKPYGLRYRALGVFHNIFNWGGSAFVNSIYEGVDNLVSLLEQRFDDCPTERFVLAGHSQGALVIHLAMLELENFNPDILTRIEAIGLTADPARVAGGSEVLVETIDKPAGSWTDNGVGSWTTVNFSDEHLTGPLPDAVASKTLSMCHRFDIVCDAGFPSHVFNHDYTASEANWIGDIMAQAIDDHL